MRILVFAHRLELGGTQTIATDLATELRDALGHDVAVFAAPGPNEKLVRQRGLELFLAPDAARHPSLTVARALSRVVRDWRPDVVHAWDWPQCYGAAFGALVRHRVPVQCTSMEMLVTRLIPRRIPITYGTPDLARQAASVQRAPVSLLEPVVNTVLDDPAGVDGASFRAGLGIADGEIMLVIVSRLIAWLKVEGIRRTIEAMDRLAGTLPLRLVIVGEGTSAEELRRLGAAVNDRHGRDVVLLPGPMVDPRPAYAASDVVVGMGSSALRGMAFGKPVLVLGEQGFSEVLTPQTAPQFFDAGFYGLGAPDRPLEEQLMDLVGPQADRAALGQWGRTVVDERYALSVGARRLQDILQATVDRGVQRGPALADALVATALRTAFTATPKSARSVLRRLLGR